MTESDARLEPFEEALREVARTALPLREFRWSYEALVRGMSSVFVEQAMEAVAPTAFQYRAAMAAFRPALTVLDSLKVVSPAFETVATANRTLGVFLEQQQDLEEVARQAVAAHSAWGMQIAAHVEAVGRSQALQLALQSHYARIAEMTIAAQRMLAGTLWESVSVGVRAAVAEVDVAKRSLLAFTRSYAALTRTLVQPESPIASFPPIVSARPPVEVLAGCRLLSVVSEDVPTRSEEDVELFASLAADIDESFESQLAGLDRKLMSLWRGAMQAIDSSNPDRKPHAVVSLRELVGHVLRTVSPDDNVRAWSSDRSTTMTTAPPAARASSTSVGRSTTSRLAPLCGKMWMPLSPLSPFYNACTNLKSPSQSSNFGRSLSGPRRYWGSFCPQTS